MTRFNCTSYMARVKNHTSPTQFRRRTRLNLPDCVCGKYEEVYNTCDTCKVCGMSVAPPPRAKISGIQASVFGDVICVDHCEIEPKKFLDGAPNLLWAAAQNTLDKKRLILRME